MKHLPRLLALAASLTFVAALPAETDGECGPGGRGSRGSRGPGGPGHGGPGHPIVRVLDADKNRELSAAELNTAEVALRTLDLDGDGTLSVAELHPGRPANSPTPPAKAPKRDESTRTRPVDPVMLALDASGDGTLSAAEIANATRSLNALDANEDGKLSSDEFHPLPPAR